MLHFFIRLNQTLVLRSSYKMVKSSSNIWSFGSFGAPNIETRATRFHHLIAETNAKLKVDSSQYEMFTVSVKCMRVKI